MSESYPAGLRYTADHEWVQVVESDGGLRIRFGITDFAQQSLGDIVFVTLPGLGAALRTGQPCGEVESTKSVSDVCAPVPGTVVARNEAIETSPETINADPYGAGWIAEVELPAGTDLASVDGLLDVEAYRALTQT